MNLILCVRDPSWQSLCATVRLYVLVWLRGCDELPWDSLDLMSSLYKVVPFFFFFSVFSCKP